MREAKWQHCAGMKNSTNGYVTQSGLMRPLNRKPKSDSRHLQQSKGWFAVRQTRRTGSSCSKELNSQMTFKQEFLETVLGNSCVKQMLKKPKGFLLIG